jgi:hypothetical protein
MPKPAAASTSASPTSMTATPPRRPSGSSAACGSTPWQAVAPAARRSCTATWPRARTSLGSHQAAAGHLRSALDGFTTLGDSYGAGLHPHRHRRAAPGRGRPRPGSHRLAPGTAPDRAHRLPFLQARALTVLADAWTQALTGDTTDLTGLLAASALYRAKEPGHTTRSGRPSVRGLECGSHIPGRGMAASRWTGRWRTCSPGPRRCCRACPSG